MENSSSSSSNNSNKHVNNTSKQENGVATSCNATDHQYHHNDSQPIKHFLDDSVAISMPVSPRENSSAKVSKRVLFSDNIGEAIVSNQIPDCTKSAMPVSPRENSSAKVSKRVLFSDNIGEAIVSNQIPDCTKSATYKSAHSMQAPKPPKFLSLQIPKGFGCDFEEQVSNRAAKNNFPFPNHPSIKKSKDKRYDSFKTWSGRLERQITQLRGRPRAEEDPSTERQKSDREVVSVDRYFDALKGPELDALKASEVIVLPDDKTWPFLLRYPVSSFGVCLGVSSQAILWKALTTSSSTEFLSISPYVNLVLWWISVAVVAIISSIYLAKVVLYFEAVRREYYHPIRVNFFFAPWIALLFLAIGVPPAVAETLPVSLWYILMTPILCLELKIYGQWMSGGQRRLSKVANPSNHLSVVGNFVGALLGASMGLNEGPIFFFAVGLAHYTVLFVTLYQRLPTNETLPKELHPVFFLFVAAPSVASMAWAKINGSFDYGARIAYFIALFLYFSLAVRVNFFRGVKFSLAWWAYTFPMTGAAIATIKYSMEVTNLVTQILSVILSAASTLAVTGLLLRTIMHAFVTRDLFPNDIAIAISDRKPRHNYHHHPHLQKKWLLNLKHGHHDEHNDIGNYLRYATSDCNDLEAAPMDSPPSHNK